MPQDIEVESKLFGGILKSWCENLGAILHTRGDRASGLVRTRAHVGQQARPHGPTTVPPRSHHPPSHRLKAAANRPNAALTPP